MGVVRPALVATGHVLTGPLVIGVLAIAAGVGLIVLSGEGMPMASNRSAPLWPAVPAIFILLGIILIVVVIANAAS